MRDLRSRAFLLVLVTVTGATVLALEILGTRVIGTHYGSSLYVWSALLSVTLVSLSVGYALGGRLADRVPREWMLYGILIAAGLSVLLVPALTAVLVPLGNLLGIAWGAIVSALVVFAVPLTLLATASPYVIRLLARDVDGVGSISGTVYSLSTMGSVGGVLAVSMWMIPTLGTRLSLRVCAGALIVLGLVGLALWFRGRSVALILLSPLPFLLGGAGPSVAGEVFRTESAFGELRVIQRVERGRGAYRMLMVNGIMQTGMPLDIEMLGPGDILESDRYFLELLPYFFPDRAVGRKGVLVGLAGGMFARVMEFYGVDLTAVEIDVKVAELAKAYFGYKGEVVDARGQRIDVDLTRYPPAPAVEGRDAVAPGGAEPGGSSGSGRVVIQDGRQYLARQQGKVDFIVVDAYNSDTIPFHLITREFFALVRDRLVDDGILAINYIGRPRDDFVTDSLYRTLGDVFGPERLQAYRTRPDRSTVQVITIFAFCRSMVLTPDWIDGDEGGGIDPLSYELSRLREDTAGPSGVVITDDLNPIDLARAGVALEWRTQTAEHLRDGTAGAAERSQEL